MTWLDKHVKTKGQSNLLDSPKKRIINPNKGYKPALDNSEYGYCDKDEDGLEEERKQISRRAKDIHSEAMLGKLNKGLTKSRMPMLCDGCYAADTCPAFGAGLVCGLNEEFDAYDTRDPQSIVDGIEDLVKIYGERTKRAIFFEKVVDGGYPGGDATGLIDGYSAHLENLLSVKRGLSKGHDGSVKFEATGGGIDILAQIFDPSNKPSQTDDLTVINVQEDKNPDDMNSQMEAWDKRQLEKNSLPNDDIDKEDNDDKAMAEVVVS